MCEEMAPQPPTLLFIVGSPAVGKMTVGREIAAKIGLRVFHNHQSIDLVLPFFEFGSPPFGRLVYEFRRRLIEEVAASDLPGLIFTYVWAFDQPDDQEAQSSTRNRSGHAVVVCCMSSSRQANRNHPHPAPPGRHAGDRPLRAHHGVRRVTGRPWGGSAAS